MKQKQDNTNTPLPPIKDKGNGHTPGEWEVIGGDSNSRYIHANKPDGTLGKIVATAHGENIEETKANAKLIASAPQLKAENEKVKRLLHDLTPGGSEFYNDPEYCAKWIREAREQNHYSLTGTIKTLKEDNQEKEDTIKELLGAIQFYQKGVDHFFKCINWGKSFLDAEAIQFMNDHGIKFSKAIAKHNQ